MNLKVGDVYRSYFGDMIIINKVFKHIVYATTYYSDNIHDSNEAVYLTNGNRVISLEYWSNPVTRKTKRTWLSLARKDSSNRLNINLNNLIARRVS